MKQTRRKFSPKFKARVASKDQKEFMRDLKKVYRADTKDLAELALDELAGKWEAKYPVVIASCRDNWEKLTTYFQYTLPIHKLIYTTNAVEGYHRQLRKVTKTKGAFTSDMALLKLVYLATKKHRKEMDKPFAKLGLNRSAAGHSIWRSAATGFNP